MKLAESFEAVLAEGRYAGKICTYLIFEGEIDTMDYNAVVQKVLDFKHKLVAIEFNSQHSPEVKTLASDLSANGRSVLLIMNGKDDIEPFRSVRGTFFLLKCALPTEGISEYNAKNFPLLKEEDEIQFFVSTIEEVTIALDAIKSRIITRPTVTIQFKTTPVKKKALPIIFEAAKKTAIKLRVD